MKTPPLLGLYSIKANSTTVRAVAARLQSHHNFELIEFSETSKIMAVNLLQKVGYDSTSALQLVGSNRHKMLQHFNIDGKSLVEEIDSLIQSHLLSNYALIAMGIEVSSRAFDDSKRGIVVSDVRTFSQAKFIQENGGYVIRVDEVASNGANDYLKDFNFDKYILNDSGLIGLNRNTDLTLESISEVVLEAV